ncbi:hypothetical protein [Streptomyces sp. PT12]|uniref:hypothetical protein n=1 Tax=Streptomyces sp. PT12 TaxID=1510197 RepID=UPI000DE2F409|nr:hypothetical protein [Streptomyces sp. PT12]RBM06258.1 hypothetical protein DEH69_26715 [Streptomyces sp. PT12]
MRGPGNEGPLAERRVPRIRRMGANKPWDAVVSAIEIAPWGRAGASSTPAGSASVAKVTNAAVVNANSGRSGSR